MEKIQQKVATLEREAKENRELVKERNAATEKLKERVVEINEEKETKEKLHREKESQQEEMQDRAVKVGVSTYFFSMAHFVS